MEKTADLTVVQKMMISTLHKEGKPQTIIVEKAGCSQSAVSKHFEGKWTGKEKCGRKNAQGAPCHLLVMVHCDLSTPKSAKPSTRRFMEMLISLSSRT